MPVLSVSIVSFRSDPDLLRRTIDTLRVAVAKARDAGSIDGPVKLLLIDNAAPATGMQVRAAVNEGGADAGTHDVSVYRIEGQGNVGYGRGHNLALTEITSDYHLILNPDVLTSPDALTVGIDWLSHNADTVAISPRVTGDDGRHQYLCRNVPSLSDLFVRGFLPARWRMYFDARLARYEMRAQIDAANASGSVLQPAIISGCFMLFRTDALRKLGGFDPRYFLYFEDYDLSLRAAERGRVCYLPAMRIVHFGGGASRKGYHHIKLFIASAWRFFNRFGWRLR